MDKALLVRRGVMEKADHMFMTKLRLTRQKK